MTSCCHHSLLLLLLLLVLLNPAHPVRLAGSHSWPSPATKDTTNVDEETQFPGFKGPPGSGHKQHKHLGEEEVLHVVNKQ